MHVIASAGWGGSEKVFVELANELELSCDVSVVVPVGCSYLDRFGEGLRPLYTLPEGGRRNLRVLAALRRLIGRLRPDVVHTHAARATEMVYWVSFFEPLCHVATKHNVRSRWVFGRVGHVTAVSQQAAASVRNPRRPVEVIHNGIRPRREPSDSQPPGGPDPTPSDRSGSPFRIVAVGRLDRYKGFDLLVRAIASLDLDLRLDIVGEGRERAALEALIAELGQEGRVRLLGHREDVPELLAAAHLQVVPSRSEGFGLVLAEGLQYSPLVLSTPVGVAPEILPDELLVEPSDLADRIGEVRRRYDHFVERFRKVKAEHAGRFLLSGSAEKYLELYERILRPCVLFT